MKLIVNGKEHQTAATNVRQLVEELGMGQQAVAVELNRNVIPRRQHEQTPLSEGDAIELVTLVGGG